MVGIEVAGFAAMTLGLVYVGSCNEAVVQSIVLSLMEHTETELSEPLACFLCLCLGLGLGLLYLRKQVMWALFCSFLVESFYLVRLYLHN
jgi:26S proteasome regulatory subunit N1